jgi:hypothetical protein
MVMTAVMGSRVPPSRCGSTPYHVHLERRPRICEEFAVDGDACRQVILTELRKTIVGETA